MYIEIRDANHLAVHNAHAALMDAGISQASVVSYNDEVHIDIWAKMRTTDTRQLIETLAWYGLHPYSIH